MNQIHRKEPLFLLVGDIVVFIVSLYVSLVIRSGEIPSAEALSTHFGPFSIIFVVFVIINFIAGLYERHTIIFKNRLPSVLLKVEIMSAFVGVLFFYMIPYLAIQPKTILFIYLIVSFVLMVLWRVGVVRRLGSGATQSALLVAHGKEAVELREEVNHNPKYGLFFKEHIENIHEDDLFLKISECIKREAISTVVIDIRHPVCTKILPRLYPFVLSGVHFFDIGKMYEEMFGRVPLSLVGENWFVENVSSARPKLMYDGFKRVFDIIIGCVFGVISLIFYPFVILAIKLDDGGSIFITQERIGKNGKSIKITKFRSMTRDDSGRYGEGVNVVTKVGAFLRKTRIDEFPQFWDIVSGRLSFVGPRPELPVLVSEYEKSIPYYAIRHLITPGLSGWAQIYHEAHPHHKIATEDTFDKLSYDLFYIKNRSILLDLKIALRTLQIFLGRSGR